MIQSQDFKTDYVTVHLNRHSKVQRYVSYGGVREGERERRIAFSSRPIRSQRAIRQIRLSRTETSCGKVPKAMPVRVRVITFTAPRSPARERK